MKHPRKISGTARTRDDKAAVPLSWTITVHVQPGARTSTCVGWKEGILYVRVHAPSREGAANTATLHLLADELGVPHSGVRLLQGAKSRYKVIRIHGLSPAEAQRRLSRTEQSEEN